MYLHLQLKVHTYYSQVKVCFHAVVSLESSLPRNAYPPYPRYSMHTLAYCSPHLCLAHTQAACPEQAHRGTVTLLLHVIVILKLASVLNDAITMSENREGSESLKQKPKKVFLLDLVAKKVPRMSPFFGHEGSIC